MLPHWQLLPPPPSDFFNNHPELPEIVATLLYHRGLKTQAEIDEFLNPDFSENVHDPFLFKDMRRAVERIFAAIEKKEKIIIHGDYDADGVAGSVILTDLFSALDYKNFSVFLPHRETDGYGLSAHTVERLAAEDARLIITCDCGISNRDAVAQARELGVDVIITDHHTIPEILPESYAIIHPNLPNENYPCKNLSGGAVAFKLMQGVLRAHKERGGLLANEDSHEALEKWSLDMVALSMVADMVPLLGEGRTLTKYGLIVMNKTRRLGLQKLLLEARLMDNDGTLKKRIDADLIGYKIAPLINAAGRLNHASTGYRMLVTDSGAEAIDLAYELNQNNQERQKLTEEYVAAAKKQMESQKDSAVLFAYHDSWPPGLVGLIASRLKDAYGKPVIVMTKNRNEIMGSGRGTDGTNLVGSLSEVAHLLLKYGGHPQAAGFTLREPEAKEEFMRAFALSCEKRMTAQTAAVLSIDAQITLDALGWDLVDVLEKFEPFGQGNGKPLYLARGVTLKNVEAIGRDGKHLRMLATHEGKAMRKVMGFGLCGGGNGKTNWCDTLRRGDIVDMVCEVGVNQWNGRRELQINAVELSPHTPA